MDVLKGWLPHLDVLRWHLVRMLAAWLVAGVLVFWQGDTVLQALRGPLLAAAPQALLLTTGVTELFGAYLRLAVWGGALLALPYWLWEVWRFIRPALYVHERKVVAAMLWAVPLLTLAGVLFGWFVMLPPILGFFLGFDADGVASLPRLADYIALLCSLLGLMGLAFNLPLALVGLVRMGLVRVETLQKQRRMVIVGVFIVAAMATPPDPLSQMMLAIPLWLLFEVALLFGKAHDPKGAPTAE
ncbi:MAG: twin-arginine translocase subunit TatC [Pseudomonadaceae bacterium]|nr:twin-arginine translocase subunit TatC [Pseudomonadaceae bacterium]